MSWKHFAMSINIYTLVLCLFQKKFKVVKVMA